MSENVETNGVAVRCIALVGCPFCGASEGRADGPSMKTLGESYYIECGCGAMRGMWRNPTSARFAWNHRHPTAKVSGRPHHETEKE